MNNYCVIDTETTGLAPPIRACEIAWLLIDEDMNLLEENCHLTDPQQAIDPGAEKIHGISWDSVKGFPSNAEICSHIPQPVVWIGHNNSYDVRVIGEHVMFNAELCTLALSRRWVKGTTNHKLGTLQSELGLPEQKLHSALGDCHTTLALLRHISKLSGRNLPQLVDLEREPKMLQTMPFGKHRGKMFHQIPSGYKDWLLDQSDLHKDIRYTLEKTRIL